MAVDVAVLGGGFAGIAAAWALRHELGTAAALLQVFPHDGAAGLYSGTLDGDWLASSSELQDTIAADSDLEWVRARAGLWERLGLCAGETLAWVATPAGIARSAPVRDRALLDLASLHRSAAAPGRRSERAVVGLPRFRRFGWKADWLARSLSELAWSRRLGLCFEARSVDLDEPLFEQATDHDLALALDQPSPQQRFATALSLHSDVDAWLVGPWLGLDSDVAAALTRRLGVNVGETTSEPGASAGARFALRRDRLLAELGIERQQATALSLARVAALPASFQLELQPWHAARCVVSAKGVVVAIGGFVGGGVELARVDGGTHLQLSLSSPLRVSLGGNDTAQPASPWGADFMELGPIALERAGVPLQRPREPLIQLAGDVVADHAGGLWAVRSGWQAGKALAREITRLR